MQLLDFTRKHLEIFLTEQGFKRFKAEQIMQWIYQKKVFSFDEMTNLSRQDRETFSQIFEITPLPAPQIFKSKDGTRKLTFTLEDGNVVEAVIIPEEKRRTLCISTQAGCPLCCAFCRTGSLGFSRNLEVREIVGQVVAAEMVLEESGQRLSNLVFMGMGEPLLNFDNLLKSIDILMDDFGLNFSNRRITVSTSGIADRIVELGERTNVNLAVSLHAVNDEKRSRIMPVNERFGLRQLLDALKGYPVGRKMIVLEYVLLNNFNDLPEDALALAKIAKLLDAKVNLIPFNTFPGAKFEPTPMKKILEFQNLLVAKHVTALIRKSRGGDELAACGQLGRLKHNGDKDA